MKALETLKYIKNLTWDNDFSCPVGALHFNTDEAGNLFHNYIDEAIAELESLETYLVEQIKFYSNCDCAFCGINNCCCQGKISLLNDILDKLRSN